jgi:glycosyltransferase involved in cell wall biosynthesis
MTAGISIIVPCYNAAKRLPQTLAHIAAQQVSRDLQWEVIVIDNASTDNTGDVALSCWPATAPVPLKVIREPRLGVRHARMRGFAEARYDLISFVEDDNWIYPDWLAMAREIMAQHPDVGACGGLGEAVCEISPPPWFERYQSYYAIGEQGPESGGDITWSRGWLFGADMTIRRSAWQSLMDRGFHFLVEDRQGTQLNSGGDVELCFALRLAGWRIWYDPRLRFRHFLQAHRLTWDYFRRLNRGNGTADVAFDPYRFVVALDQNTLKSKLRSHWYYHVAGGIRRLLRHSRTVLSLPFDSLEGAESVLYIERELGRFSALLRLRYRYDQNISDIRKKFGKDFDKNKS